MKRKPGAFWATAVRIEEGTINTISYIFLCGGNFCRRTVSRKLGLWLRFQRRHDARLFLRLLHLLSGRNRHPRRRQRIRRSQGTQRHYKSKTTKDSFWCIKDPNDAIPKGTILAIIITSISYAIVAIICAGTTKREATGNVADLQNGTYLDCVHNNCTYGSYNDYQVCPY